MLEADQMNALFDYTRESMADHVDSVISAADEQEIEEQRERWELSKLKKKYEVVNRRSDSPSLAEKDEC